MKSAVFSLFCPLRQLPVSVALWITVTIVAICDGSDQSVDFSRDILPILSDYCFPCHGPDEGTREADLRLDTQESILVVAGTNPGESELLRRVGSDDLDEKMPPPEMGQQLTASHVNLLRRWIEAGAPWKQHWAFVPPHRPALPKIHLASWATNEIDFFVLGRLEKQQLTPADEAIRERLIRRVTLDLTGLPPTPEDVAAFQADDSPNAYQQLVERLLASPRYGERMCMEWLDAARYADTNGFQGDRERTMWPWRDWVVQALNRNLPFDVFTIWQLAGDQLPDRTLEQELATGFCRNHMINGEGGRIPEENRVEYVFDQIETVGTIWMGMTVQCSRCHDHKFDPLMQEEYYKLFAFFNQTPVNGAGGDPQTPPNLEAPTRQQAEQVKRIQQVFDEVTSTLATQEKLMSAEVVKSPPQTTTRDSERGDVFKSLEISPDKRNVDQWGQLEKHFSVARPEYTQLAQRWRQTRDQLQKARNSIPRVMVMRDMAKEKHRATFVLEKGLYNQRRGSVVADVPAAFSPLPQGVQHNRLALARWLVDESHPLSARVTVNRLWQVFFGIGLVKTTEDFGVQGEKPSHPLLLDWLATELVRSGWDVKHLARLIVTSSTYRQSSRASQDLIGQDPENRMLARGPRVRLPAWMMRDQALAASGLLTGQLGGPPVRPYQPAGVWAEATFGKMNYVPDRGADLYRRSLYVFWRRIVGPTMFFDTSKRQTCSVKASRTNTPLHALVTLNDTTYVEAARAMAIRVIQEESSSRDHVTRAFRLATSRRPSDLEVELLLGRLETLTTHYAKSPAAALELLKVGEVRAEVEARPEDLAALTSVCLLVLNLDETLNK